MRNYLPWNKSLAWFSGFALNVWLRTKSIWTDISSKDLFLCRKKIRCIYFDTSCITFLTGHL